MSPEQVRGEAVDARGDIFSLGCVLHEMLTGESAFGRGSAVETMAAILKEPPAAIADSAVEVPTDLIDILGRCLEKNPEKRFHSAKDLAFALRSLLSGSRVSNAAPPSIPSRHRWRVYLVAGGVVVLGLIALVFWLTRDKPVETAGTDLDRKHLVVAAFENRTGDASLDSLGLLATDWVTQGLSQIGFVDVVPTMAAVEAVQGAKRSQETVEDPIRVLAERSGAEIVVSCAYYLEGDAIRFHARITDSAEGIILHAFEEVVGPRDAPMDAVEELRQRIMGAVVSLFDPNPPVMASFQDLSTQGLAARPPFYEAYLEYGTGMKLFGEDYPRAIDHFMRATQIDPDFMAPWFMLHGAFFNQGDYLQAESILNRLVENRERLTPFEQHWLDKKRALMRGRWSEAKDHLREMEKIAPKYSALKHLIGIMACMSNHPREAQESISLIDAEFLRGNTVGWWAVDFLTRACHMLGEWDRELEEAHTGLEYYPEKLEMREPEVRALAAMGRVEETERVVEESLALPSGPVLMVGDLIYVASLELLAHGEGEASKRMAEKALDWYRNYVPEASEKKRHREGKAKAAYLAGDWDDARVLFEELSGEDLESLTPHCYLGVLAARRGDWEKALSIMSELKGLDRPYLFGEHLYSAACIAAHLGDKDQAMDLLQGAFSQGREYGIDLHRDALLELLWDDPRFQELLRPKG